MFIILITYFLLLIFISYNSILFNFQDVRSSYDKENKTILAEIENVRKKGDKPQVVELINNDQKIWSDTGVAVKQLVDRYEKASKVLHNYQQLKESTNESLDSKLLSIETTEDVTDKTKSLEKQKENLAELRSMITDVAETIGLNPDDVPLNEIEELSLKLEKVQKALAALGDVAVKKNKMSNNVESAKRLLHDAEKVCILYNGITLKNRFDVNIGKKQLQSIFAVFIDLPSLLIIR